MRVVDSYCLGIRNAMSDAKQQRIQEYSCESSPAVPQQRCIGHPALVMVVWRYVDIHPLIASLQRCLGEGCHQCTLHRGV